ncbi:Putative restriction endonuclease [Lentzea albidocapillata subsp. violacea]|uniref:Putative restriction endonuclease n=1 Tax=Lentzea albidocapillata subsp. violacea TaxID=128104 RepID=A0A1G9YXQ5_9PSEU|nr:Uma2 family endonuclease [Lentzea albidocapillata]SDN13962.1 Putative restriction endonuclease [Lentzea albidocapillata subsp. violacea]
MSTALQHPLIGPYTVEDWLALPTPVDGSRLQLIFGHLHLTPAPSGEHQHLAYRLTRLIDDALRAAGRTDLHVVPAVNVRISTAWRTALIPDVVVLTRKPVGASFAADELALAVEVWSPGNPRAERETKMAGYAAAAVPFLWTVDQPDDLRAIPTLTAYRLDGGQYAEENVVKTAGLATVTAAPVPITLALTDLDS